MKKILLTMSLLAVCVSVRATDVLKLSLDQATELALNENRTIKIAEKEIQRVDYARKQVQGGLFPSLSGSANYTRAIRKQEMMLNLGGGGGEVNTGDPFIDEIVNALMGALFGGMSDGPMPVGSDNTLTFGLTASLPLIAPGLWKSIQMSKTDMDIALEKSRSSRLTLTNEVKKAYIQALLAQESYKVLLQSWQLAEQNLENIRNMYNQGLVAEFDLIRADVQVRNMKPTLMMAGDGVALSLMMVRVLLSLPEEVALVLTDNLASFEDMILADEVPVIVSLDRNSDLVQLDLNLRKMNQQQDLIRTQSMPTLAAFANFSYTGMGDDGQKMYFSPPFMVGVQLNVPIFNGLSRVRQSQQMKIGIEQMEIQKDFFKDNLNVQARNTINQMTRTKEQIASNKESVRLAERGVEISQVRYKTGMGTILEMNDSDLALVQARMNYYQSLSDYLIAKSALHTLLGNDE
ncbi:MAG: TolC family protein [Bacteroidales bacterium]|jgi:outer membrane protein TolC|nr:TolC family protein [Bacteroidales bacterium]